MIETALLPPQIPQQGGKVLLAAKPLLKERTLGSKGDRQLPLLLPGQRNPHGRVPGRIPFFPYSHDYILLCTIFLNPFTSVTFISAFMKELNRQDRPRPLSYMRANVAASWRPTLPSLSETT